LVDATRELLEWGAKQALKWDTYESKAGDGFASRLETYLTDPAQEADMKKWETEVAIKVAD
jgi:hypothetical protein